MVLHCPKCGLQHIDAPKPCAAELCERGCCQPEECTAWTNPPHRSHLCHGCGHIWRPADVPTNGVAAVKTKGANDSPVETVAAPAVSEDFLIFPRVLTDRELVTAQGALCDANWDATECFQARLIELYRVTRHRVDAMLASLAATAR
jgi:hypothetical protein